MCQWIVAAVFEKLFVIAHKLPGFHDVKGTMKARNINKAFSAESIVIIVESNWIQLKTIRWFVWFIWFVLFVWLKETNQTSQIEQMKQMKLLVAIYSAEAVASAAKAGSYGVFGERE